MQPVEQGDSWSPARRFHAGALGSDSGVGAGPAKSTLGPSEMLVTGGNYWARNRRVLAGRAGMQHRFSDSAMLGIVAHVHSRAGGVVLLARDMRVIACCPVLRAVDSGLEKAAGKTGYLPTCKLF